MKENLPKRKNIRLRYYDYSEEGMYFITICFMNILLEMRMNIIKSNNIYKVI